MKSTTPSRLHLCRRFSGVGVQQDDAAEIPLKDRLLDAGFSLGVALGGSYWGVADRANQSVSKAKPFKLVHAGLQNNLTPVAKAALTEVVVQLRDAWNIGPAKCWSMVHLQRKVAVSEFDHRVSRAVIQSFFQANNLFCHFQILLQELLEFNAVSEKSILRIEKLLHQPLCSFADDVGIPRRYGRLTKVYGTSDGRDRG